MRSRCSPNSRRSQQHRPNTHDLSGLWCRNDRRQAVLDCMWDGVACCFVGRAAILLGPGRNSAVIVALRSALRRQHIAGSEQAPSPSPHPALNLLPAPTSPSGMLTAGVIVEPTLP